MTVEELKNALKESRVKGDEDLFAKGYNMAINQALKLVELYERFNEEYPLGRNDWQE